MRAILTICSYLLVCVGMSPQGLWGDEDCRECTDWCDGMYATCVLTATNSYNSQLDVCHNAYNQNMAKCEKTSSQAVCESIWAPVYNACTSEAYSIYRLDLSNCVEDQQNCYDFCDDGPCLGDPVSEYARRGPPLRSDQRSVPKAAGSRGHSSYLACAGRVPQVRPQ